MRYVRKLLAVAPLAVLLGFQVSRAAPLDQLSWLSGCWISQRGEPGSEEHWLSPAGGLMLGVSRTIRNGKAIEYEYLRITEPSPGELVLVAVPSGQSETSFHAIRVGEREVVFENPDHDFPQRVIYSVEGDQLLARIEGTLSGEERAIDFPMVRSTCALQ